MRPLLLPVMAIAIGSLVHSAHAVPRVAAQLATSAPIVDVAHAGAPHKNVHRQNDAGNDTGDSEVDRLNSMQLDENYKGPYYTPGTPPPPPAPMASPSRP